MKKYCILFLYFCFQLVNCDENLVIEISDGKIEGKVLTSIEGREFYAFQSIPYAEPPLGNLRFKSPIPVQPWEGVLDGTKPHPVCPQKNIFFGKGVYEGNEDCLYLNVYTPTEVSTKNGKLPVMVFIHGGAFFLGSGTYPIYPPEYLLDHDIVLVTLNYRLGALGFLSTGDEHSPGNNGLKDQNLALKWVQKNIAHFGGNPKRVTIFGESAGGASTHYQMISPLSKGLFRGVISQSGTTFDIWALQSRDENIKNTKKLAQSFECSESSNENLIECLRKVEAKSIVERYEIFLEWDMEPFMHFRPIVEHEHPEAFISETPKNIVKKGKYQDVPWMVGLNKDEGLLKSAFFVSNPKLYEDLNEDFNNKLGISTHIKYVSNNPNDVINQIRKFYFGKIGKIDVDSLSEITKLFTDCWFVNGMDNALSAHLKNSKKPIYNYLYDYIGKISFTEVFLGKEKLDGVCHGDELFYLFPIMEDVIPNRPESESDKKMRKLLTTLWVNFAKTGNPTSELNEIIKKKWTPIKTEKHEYYLINDEIQEMKSELFKDRIDFWRNLDMDPKRSMAKEEL